jgi:IS1 family transposase
MNNLSFEKQVQVVSALAEGASIRSTERLTGIHRDTIMRLGVRVGTGCAAVHDALMRDLHVNRLELDEAWSFVGKKQRFTTPEDVAVKGDQYIFIALAATAKAIVSYRVGKRNDGVTEDFCADLRERVLGAPEISTDGFRPYAAAIRRQFGDAVAHGVIVKRYANETGRDASRRYSPAHVVAVDRDVVSGVPLHISTSYVERSNLSMRMGARRLTRLTNGFSKKIENHVAAISLYVANYNFCRVHEAHRVTPAMQLGVTDHVWTISELVEAALSGSVPNSTGRRVGRFTVIDGGVS